MASIVQNRELKFPNMVNTLLQLSADSGCKKCRNAFAVYHFPLFRFQEALLNQCVDFLFHCLGIAAVFKPDVLHGCMDGIAIGLAFHLSFQERRLPPGAFRMLRFLRVLRRFRILQPALAAGSCLFGGSHCGCTMGIMELQSCFQLFLRTGRQGIYLFLRNRRAVDIFRCLRYADLPGMVADMGLSRLAAQSMKLTCLRMLQRCQQYPLAGTYYIPTQQTATIKVHTKRDILQIRLQRVGGIGHNQAVTGAGQGNIQHPQLLADTFRRHFHRDGPLCCGRIPDTAVAVHHRQAQSQFLIT